MGKQQDYTGLRFGRLVVLSKQDVNGKWLMQCDCGSKKIISIYGVKDGRVRSCGCLHLERCKTGLNSIVHGDAKKDHVSLLHNKWREMLKRCYSIHTKTYQRYGARGIIVCDEWKNNYVTFRNWAMDNGYNKNLTIERINNNGNYEPSNCRFATWKEQTQNRRTSKLITMYGKTQCLSAWAEELKMDYDKLRYQFNRYGNFELRS